MDMVELNSKKLEFDLFLSNEYFMESMIDFGYISLFAYVFPIGGLICIFTNIFEIRMKILNLIYVYKRA